MKKKPYQPNPVFDDLWKIFQLRIPGLPKNRRSRRDDVALAGVVVALGNLDKAIASAKKVLSRKAK
jgi:hypothetical protein